MLWVCRRKSRSLDLELLTLQSSLSNDEGFAVNAVVGTSLRHHHRHSNIGSLTITNFDALNNKRNEQRSVQAHTYVPLIFSGLFLRSTTIY